MKGHITNRFENDTSLFILVWEWPLEGDKDNYCMPNAYKLYYFTFQSELYYSLSPKMSVLDQAFIDFVDVKIVWHTKLFGIIFCINKTNQHFIFGGHKTLGGRTIVLGWKET